MGIKHLCDVWAQSNADPRKTLYPCGITTDGTNLYAADTSSNTVRRVVIATGEVITVAGTAGTAGLGDGTGATALFDTPLGITTDGTALYIADGENNVIRSVR